MLHNYTVRFKECEECIQPLPHRFIKFDTLARDMVNMELLKGPVCYIYYGSNDMKNPVNKLTPIFYVQHYAHVMLSCCL